MKDKVALITGASSGIGRATAKAFAARGAMVAVAARSAGALAELVMEIEREGGTALAVSADVSKAEDIERMVSSTVDRFGRLDFAVNNAGVEGVFKPITELEEAEWDTVLNTNLKGTFMCMQHEARAILAAGNGGAIVNTGSVNSFLGFATGSAYVASKHALIGLTSSVSAELAQSGIRVNLVCPGIIKTPMHQRLRDTIGDEIYDQGILPSVHLQRAGEPEEIAKTILFLCSEDASYITGTTLTPDGGMTLTV